ncbi:MAG: hypothetical protein H7306_08120 [Bacteriovorax sp.]|nr:hypothetical protein [Rhizobacter sp.]
MNGCDVVAACLGVDAQGLAQGLRRLAEVAARVGRHRQVATGRAQGLAAAVESNLGAAASIDDHITDREGVGVGCLAGGLQALQMGQRLVDGRVLRASGQNAAAKAGAGDCGNDKFGCQFHASSLVKVEAKPLRDSNVCADSNRPS